MKTIRVVAAVIQAENAEGKPMIFACLLYTSDAADDNSRV